MSNEFQLSYLNDNDRLKAYNAIVAGCGHLWSKGKLQKDRLNDLLNLCMSLADEDPYFMAHLASYAVTKLDSKDLKVVALFANSLSDADGTPFITGKDEQGRPIFSDKYRKPNLRLVSQAGIQRLDPKMVSRIIELANLKQALGKRYKEGTHFSNSLKTAIRKWIKYREANLKAMEGIKKAGFSPTVQNLYRMLHMKPSTEVAEILGWRQGSRKKNNVEAINKKNLLNFKGMKDIDIAQKIRDEKIPVLGALGALPDKISPVIAVALLEQATGDQAVILRGVFDSQGLLKDKEVLEVFEKKIATAKTALDRVEKINTEVDKDVELVMKKAKAQKRKKDVGIVGKVFVHIDISSSMNHVIEFAKERGAIIAECVENPNENFFWGAFNDKGYKLTKPNSFEKDAFMSSLYGLRAGGMTDCLACYEEARKNGCDIDVYLTDQGHNGHPIADKISKMDAKGYARPRAVVLVDFSDGQNNRGFKDQMEAAGIPVAVIKPSSLTESALVTQAIRTAMVGAVAVIDEIMETPLLKLPEWWTSI